MASRVAEGAPRRGRRVLVLAILMSFLLAISAYGIVVANQQQVEDSGDMPGEAITAAQGLGTPLAGIGTLSGLSAPCTAWLIDVGGPSDGAAHAVTAGRCVGVEDPGTVVLDEAVDGVTLTLRSFADAGNRPAASPVRVGVDSVVWAAMRTADVALLALGASYAELAEQGIRPIEVAARPGSGEQVLMAGVPVEGLGESERAVRGTRCEVGDTSEVLESPWLWPDLQASDCPGLDGGWVGSPALDASGRAIGVASTSTVGSEELRDCYADRPCALADDGLAVVPATTYLSAVPDLAGCFPEGVLQLGPSCGLVDPEDVVEAAAPALSARPGSDVRIGVGELASGQPIGVRSGEVGRVECSDPLGWRTVLVDAGAVSVVMPVVGTFAVICVGSPDVPTPVVIEADATAPDSGAIGLEQTPVDGGVAVAPTSESPGITSFLWTAAPTGSIECATAEGYAEYTGDPAVFQVADLPVTVCVVGVDPVGTRTAPVAFEVALPGE